MNQQTLQIYADEMLGRHTIKVVKDAGNEVSNNNSFNLSSPTKQDIVNWVY